MSLFADSQRAGRSGMRRLSACYLSKSTRDRASRCTCVPTTGPSRDRDRGRQRADTTPVLCGLLSLISHVAHCPARRGSVGGDVGFGGDGVGSVGGGDTAVATGEVEVGGCGAEVAFLGTAKPTSS